MPNVQVKCHLNDLIRKLLSGHIHEIDRVLYLDDYEVGDNKGKTYDEVSGGRRAASCSQRWNAESHLCLVNKQSHLAATCR